MARIADVLLNLIFLPSCCRIAKLRLKNIMTGHRQATGIYIALLAATDTVNSCLSIRRQWARTNDASQATPQTNGGQFPLS
jgi:hypothetical protein